ncbi:unnamed protein product [Phytomonas sp. Hart1]|nr:unnamed protein product [Phytomonas sp. Hart1]|eukprot:CCW68626.1 unnamed protein product [Phytomonas sp. isolate Hart1]
MNDENISQEKLQGIRSTIHQFLSRANVYSSIRDIVDSYVAESEGKEITPNDANELMQVIKEKGVLQQLLKQVQGEISLKNQSKTVEALQNIASDEYFLHVRLNGGKAFLDNLNIPHLSLERYFMFVGLQFGDQRFCSLPKECGSNPKFTDDFLLVLDASRLGFPPEDLMEISTPFHIAVFREDSSLGVSEVIGENIIDWRKVLKTGYLSLTVELCGQNSGIPAGILQMQLELVSQKKISYSENDIISRLDRQRETITAADREFLVYARRWWYEYTLNKEMKKRKVKLFANTMSGRMVPLTHFVTPIQSVYGLTSPFNALRFVSLLKVIGEGEESSFFPKGSNDSETWLSTFIFLSQKQGHPCNHASLLCSLLLGFGIDAYCAIGSGPKNETSTFVLSRSKTSDGVFNVTVWQPVTGERGSVYGNHPFLTVDCVFNHRCFFGNCQLTNSIPNIFFDFDNEEYWKPINPLKLRLVPKFPSPPILYMPIVCHELEKSLEKKLRFLLRHDRDLIGQTTYFNDNLSYLLAQALDNYENQCVTQKEQDFSIFEQCVKGVLGPGKTFKALPLNLSNECDTYLMSVLKKSDVGKEIIETVAEDARFALRVRVFPYPEGVKSVWAMFAVEYRLLE